MKFRGTGFKFSNCNFSNEVVLYIGYDDHVPKDIQQLKDFTVLLGRYEMGYFPKEICQLTNLTDIDWEKNDITELPKEIGQLQKLSRLNLSWNYLRKLPKEIGRLQNLTYLNLYGWRLRKLPKEIWQLQNLKCLNISGHDKLHKLPKGIEQLTNLTHLYLPGNLKKIPLEISQLPKLEYLHICGYKEQTIPQEIHNMEGLFIQKNCLDVIEFETPHYRSSRDYDKFVTIR
ncbi:leucine-rich repeat domain-containing protein [Candidatus Uabimicrobium amorphum]|uniref:Disease resistance R13L4/SHOC-2-like LRR domain-containing protein n=1 Tax=Uabimicrobium amorphum TaxID=2596890 RepID=A0A5S9F755_UABAM|nr:hypothetical protein [Candidatus Uabimicrobium amorphum]BBM87274.1 hypothetical protein UABAM_05677 [Candidatus Uabimicrobium amorphum]